MTDRNAPKYAIKRTVSQLHFKLDDESVKLRQYGTGTLKYYCGEGSLVIS